MYIKLDHLNFSAFVLEKKVIEILKYSWNIKVHFTLLEEESGSGEGEKY